MMRFAGKLSLAAALVLGLLAVTATPAQAHPPQYGAPVIVVPARVAPVYHPAPVYAYQPPVVVRPYAYPAPVVVSPYSYGRPDYYGYSRGYDGYSRGYGAYPNYGGGTSIRIGLGDGRNSINFGYSTGPRYGYR